MSELVKIGTYEISTKEYGGQRVVTFKDIDTVHERPDGTAGRNFRENKSRFIDQEDFFFVKPSDIVNDEIRRTEINNAGTYLLTEQGYLMLVKSFTDDLAWEVQRNLVNNYFKVPKVYTQLELMQQSIQILNEHDTKLKGMDSRIDKLEYEIPLYGIEAEELSSHVKRKGVEVLKGKKSEAYKDTNIRTKVYRDIYDQIKREFGIYSEDGKPRSYKALKRKYIADAHEVIDCYEAPMYLQELIEDANAQMQLETA